MRTSESRVPILALPLTHAMTQGASWPPLPFSVPITLETGRGSPVVPGRWAVRWVTGGLFSWIYTHWKSLWALAAPSSPHRG